MIRFLKSIDRPSSRIKEATISKRISFLALGLVLAQPSASGATIRFTTNANENFSSGAGTVGQAEVWSMNSDASSGNRLSGPDYTGLLSGSGDIDGVSIHNGSLFFSLTSNGQTSDGTSRSRREIVEYDGATYSTFYDPTPYMSGTQNVNALALDSSGALYLSFNSSLTWNGSLAVNQNDVIKISDPLGAPGKASEFFDGALGFSKDPRPEGGALVWRL